jgi:hypothetical protein
MGSREYRFTVRVDARLFRWANTVRKESWPKLIEDLFHDIIAEDDQNRDTCPCCGVAVELAAIDKAKPTAN